MLSLMRVVPSLPPHAVRLDPSLRPSCEQVTSALLLAGETAVGAGDHQGDPPLSRPFLFCSLTSIGVHASTRTVTGEEVHPRSVVAFALDGSPAPFSLVEVTLPPSPAPQRNVMIMDLSVQVDGRLWRERDEGP